MTDVTAIHSHGFPASGSMMDQLGLCSILETPSAGELTDWDGFSGDFGLGMPQPSPGIFTAGANDNAAAHGGNISPINPYLGLRDSDESNVAFEWIAGQPSTYASNGANSLDRRGSTPSGSFLSASSTSSSEYLLSPVDDSSWTSKAYDYRANTFIPSSGSPAKRRAGDAAEKRYRVSLNDRLAVLQNSIPALRDAEDGNPEKNEGTGYELRFTKFRILDEAKKYIADLEDGMRSFQQQVAELRVRAASLEPFTLQFPQ